MQSKGLSEKYTMQNARMDETQVGIKIGRRNISNLTYADDTTLMAESEEELKNPLMKVKEESEKASLKFSIQKMKIIEYGIQSHHFMANRCRNNGNNDRLYFLPPKSLQMMNAAIKDMNFLEEKQ